MKNLILICSVVFLCFASCKKESKNDVLYYSETLLSQVNSGKLAVHGLTYNSSYLIYESMEPYKYNKYTYDNQNLLVKIETAYSFSTFSCVAFPGTSLEADPRKASVSQYIELEYNDALKLTKKTGYFINGGNPKLLYYQTFDYINGNPVKISSFNSQGQMTQYYDYTYDGNGNVTRDDLYTIGAVNKLVRTIKYEYDNKNNPFQVFAPECDPGKYTNRNNIIKETSIYYNGTTEDSHTTLHSYEYNSLDYPVKIDNLDCIYGK